MLLGIDIPYNKDARGQLFLVLKNIKMGLIEDSIIDETLGKALDFLVLLVGSA